MEGFVPKNGDSLRHSVDGQRNLFKVCGFWAQTHAAGSKNAAADDGGSFFYTAEGIVCADVGKRKKTGAGVRCGAVIVRFIYGGAAV